MNEETNFDDFVEAVKKADLPGESGETVRGGEAIPLTHTSGVSPKDWERVQQSLTDKDK